MSKGKSRPIQRRHKTKKPRRPPLVKVRALRVQRQPGRVEDHRVVDLTTPEE